MASISANSKSQEIDMKKTGRDNFSPAIIKTLERRVNAKCSNPDCRMPTSGPTVKPDKANNVGEAAHITAAAMGGPRYDAGITREQRAAIDNAIWLCSNCATKIDKDADRYSITVLNKWKRDAEDHANEELGKPPLSRQDYSALEDLAFGCLRKNLLSDAVARISNLTASEMEKLDPRFSIDVGYRSGTTSYTFNPKSQVTMALKIEPDFGAEFEKKYSDLVNHGKDLEIDAKAVAFEGSPLFKFKESADGKLVLSTHARKQAMMKFAFEGSGRDASNRVDDIYGELVGGAESATFNGKAFGEVIALALTVFFNPDAETSCSVNAMVDLTTWHGRALRTLPYFNKVYDFYDAMHRGDTISSRIEIEGVEMIVVSGSFNVDTSDGNRLYWLLRHIRNVRALLELLGHDVDFDANFSATAEDVQFVEKMYQALVSQKGLKGKKVATTTISMSIFPDASRDEINCMGTAPHAIMFEYEYATPLNLFGLKIERPRIRLTYTRATTKKLGRAGKIEPGKTYSFRVCPSDGCELFAEFVDEK